VPSPIKNIKNQTNSFTAIKRLIKKGEVIDYYPFFSGNLASKLSDADRFVIGHTENYVVYEFWACLKRDPERVAKIAESFFPNLNENTFDILKKNWYSYKDPFVRAALFFLLNRCSSVGMITHGEFDTKNFNSFALRDLKSFDYDNLHINLLKNKTILDFKDNITIINGGKYRRTFLHNEEVLGLEETEIKSDTLLKKFVDRRCLFVFNFHPYLKKIKNYECLMLDQYGRETDESNAKEIILHNVR
jgi:hypothetical protein